MGRPVLDANGLPYLVDGIPLLDTNGTGCCCGQEQCPPDCAGCSATLTMAVSLAIPAQFPVGVPSCTISLSATLSAVLTRLADGCFWLAPAAGSDVFYNPVCSNQSTFWTGSASVCSYTAAPSASCPDTPGEERIIEQTISVVIPRSLACGKNDDGDAVFATAIEFGFALRGYCADASAPAWTCGLPSPPEIVEFARPASECPTGVYAITSTTVAGVTGTLTIS